MLGIWVVNLVGAKPVRSFGQGPVVAQPVASPTASKTAGVAPESSPPATTPVTASPAPEETPAADKPPLTVLNSSSRTRLARRAADEFEDAGWPIAFVGNTRFRAAVTTVYYAAGQQQVALDLQRAFPGIRRVRARPRELPGTGLTVVLTREYTA